ncbi:MAG: hypothetical protein RLZZ474_1890 [Bacteroidota bacterium]|jgi:hypothetical protein
MDQRKIALLGLLFCFSSTFGQKPTLVEIGKRFIGKPYRANMLSNGNPEVLVTSLEAFDCVTLLENSLAIKYANGIESFYPKALMHVRYAGDSLHYEKRYHYFTDAMQTLGYPLIIDSEHVTQIRKDFSFLSTYLRKQSVISVDLGLLENRERALAKKAFQYTAVVDLPTLIPLIQSGDLVAFVTSNPHLDFLHTGMLVRQNNVIRLLHASQDKKQVVLSDESLQAYLKSHPKFIGICVFRPIFKE